MTEQDDIFQDLVAECDAIDSLVAGLDASRWALPTPAPGWSIADQIAHLTFIFHLAGTAASDTAAFHALIERAGSDFNSAVHAALADFTDEPQAMLTRWRAERAAAIKALAAVPPDKTVPWLVRPLPAAILAGAGIMEVFGHGQDIADALHVPLERTDRIKYLAEFGVLVWDFGYQARGLTPPDTAFRFELTAPSGALWEFGPVGAEQRIFGPALDFCLLITRRRHRDDLAVSAAGADADRWLDIAQAYRGPAGPGREPGQFAH